MNCNFGDSRYINIYNFAKLLRFVLGTTTKVCSTRYLLECDEAANYFLPGTTIKDFLKDFLCSDHLLESFYRRIFTLKLFHNSNFYHKRTQKDRHYRENPSKHELLLCHVKNVWGPHHALISTLSTMLQFCEATNENKTSENDNSIYFSIITPDYTVIKYKISGRSVSKKHNFV